MTTKDQLKEFVDLMFKKNIFTQQDVDLIASYEEFFLLSGDMASGKLKRKA